MHQGDDHHLHVRIVGDESQRPQSPQQSQDLDDGYVYPGEDSIDDGCHDNEEIELRPGFSQVASIVENETQSDRFDKRLTCKNYVEEVVDLGRTNSDWIVFRELNQVAINRQFYRREDDQDEDDSLETTMGSHSIQRNATFVLLGE